MGMNSHIQIPIEPWEHGSVKIAGKLAYFQGTVTSELCPRAEHHRFGQSRNRLIACNDPRTGMHQIALGALAQTPASFRILSCSLIRIGGHTKSTDWHTDIRVQVAKHTSLTSDFASGVGHVPLRLRSQRTW
jgi:hypothetical protein